MGGLFLLICPALNREPAFIPVVVVVRKHLYLPQACVGLSHTLCAFLTSLFAQVSMLRIFHAGCADSVFLT